MLASALSCDVITILNGAIIFISDSTAGSIFTFSCSSRLIQRSLQSLYTTNRQFDLVKIDDFVHIRLQTPLLITFAVLNFFVRGEFECIRNTWKKLF